MSDPAFPIFDLSKHEDWPQALGSQIVEACKVWGFMVITGHGIAQTNIDRMFQLHKDFCDQPFEVKSECCIDGRQIGYDLKRSKVGVNECTVFGGVKGDIVEGTNVPSWWDTRKRADVEDFKGEAHALGVKFLQVFAREFGLPTDYFSSAHQQEEGPGSVLRMLHYPKLSEKPTEDFPRLYSHTDWGSLTFVWPQSGGLEIETPSKEWMEVPVIPGSIIVNVGDALSLWSGRSLKSTLHKISFDNLPIDQDRWSMAYFLNANTDAKLEVLRRDADGTLTRSKGGLTLTAGEYHQARLYMSQKEDAKNNWIGKMTTSLDSLQPIVKAVESLGVANGSGTVNFSPTPIKA